MLGLPRQRLHAQRVERLYLTFAIASSQTGPMYFDVEWGEEENGPLASYTKIGEIISPTGTRATSSSSSSSNFPTR